MKENNFQQLELADLFANYPASNTPELQTLITAKKEFRDKASNPGETLSKKKKYLNHQEFTHRFLRAYDRFFITDETGTGKSCSVIGFTEYVIQEIAKRRRHAPYDESVGHIKRVIILLRSKGVLRTEMLKQIICKCSSNLYEENINRKTDFQTSEKQIKKNATSVLKKAGYEITTYTVFASEIRRKYGNDLESIKRDYSDTIFWIDEAHNLLVDPGEKDKKNVRLKSQTYETLHEVFHLIERSKIILSSATPMLNSPKDLIPLINLLLPEDGVIPDYFDHQVLSDDDIAIFFPEINFDPRKYDAKDVEAYFRGQIPSRLDINQANIEELEPYFRGKMGFIRSSNLGVEIKEKGQRLPSSYLYRGEKYPSDMTLFLTEMSDFQREAYIRAQGRNTGQSSSIRIHERQASLFVFPDGYWGEGFSERERTIVQTKKKEDDLEDEFLLEEADEIDQQLEKRAFRRYVIKEGNNNYRASKEFLSHIDTLPKIRRLSSKFGTICQMVLERPDENFFIYGEYVIPAITLGLCLESLGFVRFQETTSIFVSENRSLLKSYCTEGGDRKKPRRLRANFKPESQGGPPRYALLTGATSDVEIPIILEAMNSYENRHGDILKILISSSTGKEGINIMNGVNTHILGGEWTPGKLYQAISRTNRLGAFDDLLEERKDQGYLDNTPFYLNVYKHAAIYDNNLEESIDVHMYRTAERKDMAIRQVMKIIKQVAVGCQIHYQRNVRLDEKDGSKECDYGLCRYRCYDPPPETDDYSTYDLYYAQEFIDEMILSIKDIFRQENVFSFQEILSVLNTYKGNESKYLLLSLEKIIAERIELRNRFGYLCHLKEDFGIFYLTLESENLREDDIPSLSNYYNRYLNYSKTPTLPEVYQNLESLQMVNRLDKIALDYQQNKKYRLPEVLNSLILEEQIYVLEEVIYRHVQGQDNNFLQAVMDHFQRMWFYVPEPREALQELYQESILIKKVKKGRKKKEGIKRKVKKLKPEELLLWQEKLEKEDEKHYVYLHILYSQIGQSSYANVARFLKGEGTIRLLDPEKLSRGWVSVSEAQKPIYNTIIQVENMKRLKVYEDAGIYGFILPDKIFRIRNKLDEDPTKSKSDLRNINRGRKCTNMSQTSLINIMWSISMDFPSSDLVRKAYSDIEDPANNREEMIEDLLAWKIEYRKQEINQWSEEQLEFFYQWFIINPRIPELCRLIEAYMQENNLILS